jgi:large subunit ribosomal protein L4
METSYYSTDGSVLGKFPLAEKLFDQKVNEHLLWEVVRYYQANQRQGTVSTKTRAEVRGGGKKPWRQKGTGRARHGSTRSPIWVGGGAVFGPRPHDFKLDIPKKKRQQALAMALSDRARDGKVIVVDDLKASEPKTKIIAAFVKKLNLTDRRVLLVAENPDRNVKLATRNIPNLTVESVVNVNAWKVLSHEYLVITRGACEKLEKR